MGAHTVFACNQFPNLLKSIKSQMHDRKLHIKPLFDTVARQKPNSWSLLLHDKVQISIHVIVTHITCATTATYIYVVG